MDSRDNLLNEVVLLDFDADGTVDDRREATYTYDSRGNRLSIVADSDHDGDGTLDSRVSVVYTYTRL